MSSELRKRSPFEWFLESFFQERNIKWMLALGMLIVFGSSLMLVTRQWDQWAPLWKALTIIGYSGAVFVGAEVAYHRLGLRNTGTVMMALTLLLLPLSFLGINRLATHAAANASAATWAAVSQQVGLLAVDGVLTFFASRRIFTHFLRGPQPTVVASYLTLAVLGGVLTPSLVVGWEPLVGLLLWSVFAAGTVKSARQVFWLAEEHRLPRVCGFLPILLLGSQFLTLFVLNGARQVAAPWLGLGCVLTAVPVLLTTDAIAKVFQQRTGDLVRPLPWSLVLPLFVGLVLSFVGVGLAAVGFPRSLALAPAAGLAAAMLFVAARRTKHSAFVWAGLVLVALTYQATPAYFHETARLVVHSAASAVQEQRLPVAFYGLTWLPLIAVASFASLRAARRGDTLIEVPCRRFAMSVAALLFGLCFTHAKAILPVSAAMTLTFGLQAVLFRQRLLLAGSAAAFVALTSISQFFATSVCGWQMSDELHRLVMLAGAAVMLILCGRIERRVCGSLAVMSDRVPLFGVASWIQTAIVGAIWLWNSRPEHVTSMATLSGAGVAGLLLVHAVKWLKPGLGELALGFVVLAAAKVSGLWLSNDWHLLLGWTLPSVLLWFGGHELSKRTTRVALAFGKPSLRVSGVALTLLTLVSHVGLLILNSAFAGSNNANSWPLLLPAVLMVLWPFDVARRSGASHGDGRVAAHETAWRMSFASLGCVAVLTLTASVLLGAQAARWIPSAWALVTGIAAVVLAWWKNDVRDSRFTAIAQPVRVISMTLLILLAAVTLLWTPFAAASRLAGVLATFALLLEAVLRCDRKDLDSALLFGQWQLAALLVHGLCPSLRSLGDLFSTAALPGALPVALTLASGFTLRRWLQSDLAWIKPSALNSVLTIGGIGYALAAATVAPSHEPSVVAVCLAVLTFAVLACGEFAVAVRRQQVDGVWMAQGIVGAAVAWLLLSGVLTFGNGVAMFACLGGAVVSLTLARLCSRSPRTQFAAVAVEAPAHVLPLVAAVIGVLRHCTVSAQWLGLNSLGLLFASAFYFWQGMEANEVAQGRVRRDRFVVSAMVLNAALAVLWRELRWFDPQFFMIPAGLTILWLVELLKREIPEGYRDPLRYAGALTILVSPTFHIVSGSWLHLMSLMVCSVVVVLLAMGLRLRALMYSGTAFLLADLVAMVIRGSIDHPNLLWLAGLAVGAGVIALGAVCENHRENLLARLRLMAAELRTWK